ncbi:FAD/NAD(P)-binding domain-containing protein [Wolfiporia cocos MD-104 SS10]|uniref:FAD/NAD(P)-binding domain-containing protein n=1 Tax=Wolfiporia cocos (strain MD-104) TaxID=742152 RepID=A0A2H3JP04_WOLCO|nr:FAD/NAD(P)-binding domain-containing protein [Wolfiporia cocos MD-104 SS10]
MSKKTDDKQNVVVVGGGFVGSLLARALSAKLDPARYTLILINERPYMIQLIAGARMIVSDTDRLEDTALIPYDKLFVNGNGQFYQGRVEQIDEAGSAVVLKNGERISYAALILATGSTWSGPLDFPEAGADVQAHIREWRDKVERAKDIFIVGGGAVGIEYAGEIRDIFPDKKITIIHSSDMLLNSTYPDKYRRDIARRCRAIGVKLVFGEYVDQFPAPGTVGLTTRRGTSYRSADLVIPAFGARPNTRFIASLGADALAESGCVKVHPTLEVQGHPGVFALGDIIEWHEQKQAAKGGAHVPIVVENVLSFLARRPLAKQYKGSIEMILIPLGKSGGSAYLDILWGITLGAWFARMVKGKDLFVPKSRKDRGL